jgi:hypothetical protein
MRKISVIVSLLLVAGFSCTSTKSTRQSRNNFFAIPFMAESPVSISCDQLQKGYDTAFFMQDSTIERIIGGRLKDLKPSQKHFSDYRIRIVCQKNQNIGTICIDIGGQLTIKGITYEKDDIVLNQILAFLPNNYQ